jgi:tRNA(Ile2)-agmatinylcytidine synthase
MHNHEQIWHLAIDDTDSSKSGCTTYTLSLIIDEMIKQDSNLNFIGYPQLIRCNPNVPYKTRGNGALVLRVKTILTGKKLIEIAKKIIQNQSDEDQETQPIALVLSEKELKGYDFKTQFYYLAMRECLDYRLIELNFKNLFYWPSKERRSIIGSLAALCFEDTNDYTFELITYRLPKNLTKIRLVDVNQVEYLQSEFEKEIFSCFDNQERRELIAPSGPDPVLYGIRGEKPYFLIKFMNKLRSEPVESYTIFQTNQATNHHVLDGNNSLRNYSVFSGVIEIYGEIQEIQGGHVKLKARYNNVLLEIIAFEPTKTLPKVLRESIIGDIYFIHGAVDNKNDMITIKLEKIRIIHLEVKSNITAPICKNCELRTTSAGFLKGYKCNYCNFTTFNYEITYIDRNYYINQQILPTKGAQRHLTRPYSREFKKNPPLLNKILKYDDFRKVNC